MVEIISIGAMVSMIAFCLLMLVRNEIVFRCVGQRIDEVYQFNMAQIRKGDYRCLAKYDHKYDAMMWQFSKWTYKQFFPSEVSA